MFTFDFCVWRSSMDLVLFCFLLKCFFMTSLKKPVKVSQGSTYSELLSVIEEMSREIRPTYAGSKSAMERLKRGTLHFSLAMILLKACEHFLKEFQGTFLPLTF